MDIQIQAIESIRPYQKNPRINDGAVDAVAASIREFGFRQPIVVDADGVIIAGHTRWKAAQKLGLKKVPVHVAVDLTPEQVKAYRLADNKTAELAEWDFEILPIELAELQDSGFDLDLLAFNEKELTQLLNVNVKQGETDPDDVPEPPDDPVTKRGDIWILGNHRLMCGDSANSNDVDTLIAGRAMQMCCCDPPYGVRPMYIA
ncbi:MAG: ParB N-terminal domain-containing protein [Planctomycetaceae bacterium]|nr:ParB N-terminal domain-containing protein [Planctomycetaceae bacterium]